MVTSIGALQRNASAVIRRVAASGIAEEITAHGHVVALLSPPPRGGGLEALRREGHVVDAEGADRQEVIGAIEALLPVDGLREALWEQRDSDR